MGSESTNQLIHPGQILADELVELELSPTELSRRIGVPPNRVSQIINGKRDISADTALRLGRYLGAGPEVWMNLQTAYDLARAKVKLGIELEKIRPW